MVTLFKVLPSQPLASGVSRPIDEYGGPDANSEYSHTGLHATWSRARSNGVSLLARLKVCSSDILSAYRAHLCLDNQEDDAVYKANPGDKVTYNCKLKAPIPRDLISGLTLVHRQI